MLILTCEHFLSEECNKAASERASKMEMYLVTTSLYGIETYLRGKNKLNVKRDISIFFFQENHQAGRLQTNLQNPHEKMMRGGGMCLVWVHVPLQERCNRWSWGSLKST